MPHRKGEWHKEMSTVSYVKMQCTFNWAINVYRNVEVKHNNYIFIASFSGYMCPHTHTYIS